MSREKLLNELKAYRQKWPQEQETADHFLRFVSENQDCFERSLAHGHITGSAWIVHPSEARILLTHHRKLDNWFQLGGHADGDQIPLRVALKEATEESGLPAFKTLSDEIFDIDIHLIPARKTDPAHYHYDIRYLLQPKGNAKLVISAESLDLKWVELAQLQNYTTEPSILRMASKWSRISSQL